MNNEGLKQRLIDLRRRVEGMTSAELARSLWMHWSDVATLTEALETIETLEKRLSALKLEGHHNE